MRKAKTLAIFGLLIFRFLTKTYGQVSIDAEFRPRSEFMNGFNKPLLDTLNPAFITMQRTRISFNYKSGNLNTSLVLQDSRVFGETGIKQHASTLSGGVGVFEAWAELLLLSRTSFKIGRQAVQFEDGRLFSSGNWGNTGKAHDLAQLIYFAPDFNVQFAFARNNQKPFYADSSFYNISQMYKQLTFLHLQKTFNARINLSLLGIDEGFEKAENNLGLYHRYTVGGTLQLMKDKLPYGFFATSYYQFGKSTATVDLKAFLFAVTTNYSITNNFGIFTGIDYYSGSDPTLAPKKTNTWNKLPYGVNHSFNGYMEYWAVLPKGGLFNYFGGINLNLTNKFCSKITFYGFNLAKQMNVDNQTIQKNIGSELDLVFDYKFSEETAIQFAWCAYIITDGTRLLKYNSTQVNTKFPQYAYLMFTFKPKLYKTLQEK